MLTITTREFLLLPYAWQYKQTLDAMTPRERIAARFSGKPYSFDTPPKSPVTRTVLSTYEEVLAEMVALQEQRHTFLEQFGELPPEMEQLFAARRQEIRDRGLATLRQSAKAAMGTEEHREY